MQLDYEKRLKDSKSCIVATHTDNSGTVGSTTTSFVSLIEQDFSIGIQPSYNTNDISQNGGTALKLAQEGLGLYNGIMGNAETILTSISQTITQWTGASKPQFNVPMTFVQYSPSVNIMQKVKDLMRLSHPNISDVRITAPGNYSYSKATAFLSKDANFNGVWSLAVGHWFRATDLVLLGANIIPSKEITKATKTPVIVRLNLTFSPAMGVDANTAQSWFITRGSK